MSKVVADTIEHSTAGSLTTDYVVNGSAKAYLRFDHNGGNVIDISFNIASVSDVGTGLFTPTYTNVFSSSTDYSVNCMSSNSGSAGGSVSTINYQTNSDSLTSSATPLVSSRVNETRSDMDISSLTIHGDLA